MNNRQGCERCTDFTSRFTSLWLVYPPLLWRACPPYFWQAVFGKSGCCEEECTPIIIRDACGAPRESLWQQLVSRIRFANDETEWHETPTVIPITKSRDGTKAIAFFSRGKAFHFVFYEMLTDLTRVKRRFIPPAP